MKRESLGMRGRQWALGTTSALLIVASLGLGLTAAVFTLVPAGAWRTRAAWALAIAVALATLGPLLGVLALRRVPEPTRRRAARTCRAP